jgi:hypothetical protein
VKLEVAGEEAMQSKMTRAERDEKIRQLEGLSATVKGRETRSFMSPVLERWLDELKADRALDAIVDARAIELEHAQSTLKKYVAATRPARLLSSTLVEADDVMVVRLPTSAHRPAVWDCEGEEVYLPFLGFERRVAAATFIAALERQNETRPPVAVVLDDARRWSVHAYLRIVDATLDGSRPDEVAFNALSSVGCTRTLARWFAEEQRSNGANVAARAEWSEPRSMVARAVVRRLAVLDATPRAAYAWWLAQLPEEPAEPEIASAPTVARPGVSSAQVRDLKKVVDGIAARAAHDGPTADESEGVTDGAA